MVLNIVFFSVGVTALTRAGRYYVYCTCVCMYGCVFSVLCDGIFTGLHLPSITKYILQLQKKGTDKLLSELVY